MINHIGTETRSKLFKASSKEYWTMCIRMIQRYNVRDEDFLIVNLFY